MCLPSSAALTRQCSECLLLVVPPSPWEPLRCFHFGTHTTRGGSCHLRKRSWSDITIMCNVAPVVAEASQAKLTETTSLRAMWQAGSPAAATYMSTTSLLTRSDCHKAAMCRSGQDAVGALSDWESAFGDSRFGGERESNCGIASLVRQLQAHTHRGASRIASL